MADTTTTAASIITENFQPGFVDELSRYSELLSLTDAGGNLVFERVPGICPSSVRWSIHTTGSTPEVYVENQPTTPATNQGWGEAVLTPTWFRVLSEYTGHLQAAANAGELLVDAMTEGEMLIEQDLSSLVNYSFINASYNGLQVAVDSTTTYAGIARGSATYWESEEHSLSGALTMAELEDETETMEGHTHQGRLGLLVSERNQMTNYSRLGGVAGASNTSIRVNLQNGPGGTPVNFGYDMDNLHFGKAPWRQLNGMTNTVILGLDTRPGCWKFLVHQPYLVQFQGRSADNDQFHHKIACLIQCKRPKRHMKITGVTA
jgi:hypothetical protein